MTTPTPSRPSPSRLRLAQQTESDPRWAALQRRDPSFDGQFVYAVATTGVYCRPSCRARRARPENVAFFASPAEAEQRGFRACQRCRPNQPSRQATQAAQVAALCQLIASHDPPPTLAELAAHIGQSRFHTQRLFKAVTGISPKAYASAQRAERLRAGLARQDRVTTALYDAGFGSSSRLYEQATALLGMQPGEFRDGGRAQAIAFAVAPCALGQVLVAATARGLCAVTLGDDRAQLESDLRQRFPQARLQPGDANFAALLAAVVRHIDDPAQRAASTLPIDIQGTAFQQRVWQALRQIPAGQTRSYRQIAEALGQPQASRAVARACADNPLAVLIPCHRIVRSDGNLSGYRWGIERKQALLSGESAVPAAMKQPRSRRPRRSGP